MLWLSSFLLRYFITVIQGKVQDHSHLFRSIKVSSTSDSWTDTKRSGLGKP